MSTRFLGSTAQPLPFFLKLTSDHITGATGKTPTVTIRKVGGSFAAPAGTVTEIANGWYEVAGNATDLNTLGPLQLHATNALCDPVDLVFEVVAIDPFSKDVEYNSISVHNTTGAAGTFAFALNSDVGPALVLINDLDNGNTVVFGANSVIDFAGGGVQNFPLFDTTVNIVNNVSGNIGGNVNGSVGSVLGDVGGNITGNVGGSVGSVTGSVDSVRGNVGGDLLGSVIGAVQGAVASVTGSVGSVVGNVGGNVVGSVGSIPTVTLSSAYDAAKTCAQAATALSTAVWTGTMAGRLDAAISSRSTLTLSQAVNGIFDELLSGHTTTGTAGAALRLIRQFAVGKKDVSGNTLRVYAEDNSTVIATLDLTPHGGPFTAQSP